MTVENELSPVPPAAKHLAKPWWRFETALVALLLFAFLAINFATGIRFPAPWQDEAFFTDPAVNYATGQGFISTLDSCGDSTPHSFFACNTPLYPYLLGNWFRLVGFSVLSARSLNYILFSLAALVLWLASRRLNLIATPSTRLIFLGLLLLGYGDGFIFRSARYDCLGLLLLALAVLAGSLRSRPSRLGILALIGVLLPFAGMQLVCYSAVCGAVLLLCFRGRFFGELAALSIGILLGVAAVFSLFAAHGVLRNFLLAIPFESVGRFERFDKDPSVALLLAACLLLALDRIRTHSLRLASPLAFGIITAVVVPAVLLAARKFPIYYSWMAYIPLALAFAAEIPRKSTAPSRSPRNLSVLCACAACLLGLPVQLASTAYYWKDRNPAQVDALIRKEITNQDCVYTAYSAYFAVRGVTPHVVNPFALSPEDRARITILVLPQKVFEEDAPAIGGEWYDTGAGITDHGHDLLPNKTYAIVLQRRIDFRIYRRVGSMPPEGQR